MPRKIIGLSQPLSPCHDFIDPLFHSCLGHATIQFLQHHAAVAPQNFSTQATSLASEAEALCLVSKLSPDSNVEGVLVVHLAVVLRLVIILSPYEL